MFVRPEVYEKGLPRLARTGDGFLGNPSIVTNAAAGAQNISLAQILAGIAQFTGAAGAVAYTLPLAADIIAAMPDMDIGDNYLFAVSNTAAQNATITTNTGITLSGNSAVVNADVKWVLLTRTGTATMNAVVL